MPGPFDLYGIPDVDALEAPKPVQPGDFTRGAKVALGQLAPIAKGVVGLVGATAEQVLGEGGLATGVKNWGLRGFTEGMKGLEPLQRETDDVTVAWQRAKDGDLGALLDWAQWGLGYAVGQAGEAVGAALLGAGVGAAMAPQAAPVAGAAGAVTGLVAKGAVRNTAVGLIERAVAKEANRIMAEGGGRIAAQEAVTIATRGITREIGASGALLTLGTGQELGSIYPEAEAEAIKRGEQMTGADLARVWASGLAAGGIEGLTDRLGIQAALGKIRAPGAQTRLGQAGLTGVGGAALEGATEAVQTGIERFGAQKDILSPEGVNEIINASALGAIGGGAIGGAIGAVQGPQRARSNAAFEAIGAAKSADEAITAFEQTYEPITIPPEFDADGAMRRLEAQRRRDEDGLRNPSMPDAPRGTGMPAAPPSEPQLGPAEPFADRLLSLRDLIGDSRNRQQVRDTLGPVALNDLMYYLSAADNASLPGQTSDRMLQVAEAILNRAQIQREERPGVGGKPAQAAIDATAAPAQIPLDTKPTGRIRVDADGVAVQEIGADVVSDADRARAQAEGRGQGMTGSFPQGFRDRPGVLVGEGTFVSQTSGQVAPTLQIEGPKTAETVDSGAHEAATSPTNGKTATKEQILGGNAELGHTMVSGLDISIENPAGTERVDLKNDPPKWRNKMLNHYGYIRNTIGHDKDHVDTFLKEGTATNWAGTVFVVDQYHDNGKGAFDESKVMLGFDTIEEAKAAYRSAYAKDWNGMRAISAMPFDEFKRWVYNPELTKKPFLAPMAERAAALKPSPQDAIADDGLRLGDARRNMPRAGAADTWGAAPAAQRQQWLRAIGRTDLADKAGVAKWTWDKLSMNLRARLPRVMKEGAPDAEAVRGDAGQVREGGEGGQSSVQRGPEQGRGDLQRPPQERPGEARPVRAREEESQAAQVAQPTKEKPSAATTKQSPEQPAATEDRPGDQGAVEPPRPQEQEEGAVPEEPVAPTAAPGPEPSGADAKWWKGTLTLAGRERALNEIGESIANAAMNWVYVPAAVRGKLLALRDSGWSPSEAAAPAADAFARFDGIMLERKVKIAETGQVATLRFDAGKALRDLDARERVINQLRDCVMRGAA